MLATGIDYSLLAHWTPAQLWDVCEESQKQSREIEEARAKEATGDRTVVPFVQDQTPVDPPPPKPPALKFTNWGQKVKGMGYEKHRCWDVTAEERAVLDRGEDPSKYAPFLVPRDILRARIEAEMHELNERGFFEAGLPIVDSVTGKTAVARFAKTDLRALQNLIDRRWKREEELFARAKAKLEGKG